MNGLLYVLIFALLFFAELFYFHIADKFNIIDKPNERSSHASIVLRGGGVIFLLGLWTWAFFFGFSAPWFLMAVTLIGGVSFIDDVRSLPDSVRLVAQFIAMVMMFYQLDILRLNMWWVLLLALIVCVGASNVINFMDGINGITAGYSLSVLLPLMLVNEKSGFVDPSLIYVSALSVLVFCLFNFRPKGKAKCFAGDVGSISIAYILLFMIGSLIIKTTDVTYLVFLLVYGVDGSPDGKAMIKAGFLEGTAAQSPIKIGEKAVQTAYSYLAGETVKKHVTIPVELITADNLKLYDMTGWQ